MHSLLVYVLDLLWVYASSFATPFVHLYLQTLITLLHCLNDKAASLGCQAANPSLLQHPFLPTLHYTQLGSLPDLQQP